MYVEREYQNKIKLMIPEYEDMPVLEEVKLFFLEEEHYPPKIQIFRGIYIFNWIVILLSRFVICCWAETRYKLRS